MKILNTDYFISERIKVQPITNAELDAINNEMSQKSWKNFLKLMDEHGLTPYEVPKDNPEQIRFYKKGLPETYDNLEFVILLHEDGTFWKIDWIHLRFTWPEPEQMILDLFKNGRKYNEIS